MKILRILTHGLVLTVANICGVVMGFVLFYRIPVSDRIPLQLGTAFVFTIGAYLIWKLVVDRYALHLSLQEGDESIWAFLSAPVWMVLVFVPLHYVFSGYVTKLSNIILACGFQLPPNALALWAASVIRIRSGAALSL